MNPIDLAWNELLKAAGRFPVNRRGMPIGDSKTAHGRSKSGPSMRDPHKISQRHQPAMPMPSQEGIPLPHLNLDVGGQADMATAGMAEPRIEGGQEAEEQAMWDYLHSRHQQPEEHLPEFHNEVMEEDFTPPPQSIPYEEMELNRLQNEMPYIPSTVGESADPYGELNPLGQEPVERRPHPMTGASPEWLRARNRRLGHPASQRKWW